MNRKLLILLPVLLCIANMQLQAQNYTPATAEQKQIMLERIPAAAKQLKSLVCEFEQIKELSILDDRMTSKGKMYYRNDNCVRWEYTSPYVYAFVFNNNRILMQAENSRSVMDVKSNSLFQEIVKIMISSISGSGLTDAKSFAPQFYWSEKNWMVALTPQQKEVKQMFSTIKLYFNIRDYSVDTVSMEEKGGDRTVIQLSKKQLNEKIDDSKFRID